jgi:DNA repair ATPase RecN
LLQSISCKNFQSLQDVEIELGKFTVIVGASSSGKSALIRAVRAIADNSLNPDNIMQGTKHSSVSIKTDMATATIERSVGGSSVYKITKIGSEESSFTKLNRQVPSQVTEVLGIPPSTKEVSSISFASQHDAPYLLTETSSNAARILGELTNVSTIFAAVSRATKKAKAASTLLNLRKKDQEAVMKQIVEYQDIKAQATAMSEVEDVWEELSDINAFRVNLAGCIDRAEKASDALSRVRLIPEPPSMAELLSTQRSLQDFKSTLKSAILASRLVTEQSDKITALEQTVKDTEEHLHKLLADIGQCPLCHQEVKNNEV